MTTRTVRPVLGGSEEASAASALSRTAAPRAKGKVEGDHRSAVPAVDRLPGIEASVQPGRLDTPGLGRSVKVGIGIPKRPADRRALGIRLDRSDQNDEKADRQDEDAGFLLEVELLSTSEHDRRGDQREASEDDGDPDSRDRAVHRLLGAVVPPPVRE